MSFFKTFDNTITWLTYFLPIIFILDTILLVIIRKNYLLITNQYHVIHKKNFYWVQSAKAGLITLLIYNEFVTIIGPMSRAWALVFIYYFCVENLLVSLIKERTTP